MNSYLRYIGTGSTEQSGKLYGEALVFKTEEVSSILTSDRLDRVTSLNNHGLLTTDRKEVIIAN